MNNRTDVIETHDNYQVAVDRVNELNKDETETVLNSVRQPKKFTKYGVMKTRNWNLYNRDKIARTADRFVIYREVTSSKPRT